MQWLACPDESGEFGSGRAALVKRPSQQDGHTWIAKKFAREIKESTLGG